MLCTQKPWPTLADAVIKTTQNSFWSIVFAYRQPGGGGYFRTFWVGMCRWDPGTLSL